MHFVVRKDRYAHLLEDLELSGFDMCASTEVRDRSLVLRTLCVGLLG